jgi:hypothetical protein
MKSSKSEYVVDGTEQSGNLPTSRSKSIFNKIK